jgi:hypothetical protein
MAHPEFWSRSEVNALNQKAVESYEKYPQYWSRYDYSCTICHKFIKSKQYGKKFAHAHITKAKFMPNWRMHI